MSKAQKTRQKIIDTAQNVLYETGLSKFRIDELVGQLGITRQTFYRYFKSKDELIKFIIIEHGKALSHEVFGELVRQELPFRDFLAEGVIYSVEIITSDNKLSKIIGDDLQLAISLMISNFTSMEEELYPIVEPFVLDAKAKKVVKPDVTTQDIMRWVFRSFLSEMLLSSLDPIDKRRAYLKKMMVPAICIEE